MELERERALMLGLEQNNIEEKPWYLRGEALTQDRPEDSVLQQQLEYDIAARQSKSLVPYCIIRSLTNFSVHFLHFLFLLHVTSDILFFPNRTSDHRRHNNPGGTGHPGSCEVKSLG